MTQDELLRLIDEAAADGRPTLDLSGENLSELPPEIGKLTNLKTLVLGRWDRKNKKALRNNLSTLPDELGLLTELRSLYLYGNQFTDLPKVVVKLSKLQSLNLNVNQLEVLPEAFGRLTNLRLLDLGSNQFTNLPEVVGQIVNLRSLSLSGNKLTSLSEVIGQLVNLKSLYLISCQITDLPKAVGQLIDLQLLYLWENQLTSLPKEIGHLTSLRTLNLRDNRLTSLPEEIGHLTNLLSLNLWKNHLTSLPEEIGHLTNLLSLNLRNNQLTNLPEVVGHLTNLQSLDLMSNQLTNLPEVVGQLTNLQSLHLMNTQLVNLPEIIGQLTSLQSLNLSHNQLINLPKVVSRLPNLQSLYLWKNQLTSFPEGIDQLSHLQTLDLRNNQLTNLPTWIQRLTYIREVDIRQNPLPIPPEVLGDKDIFKGEPNSLADVLKFYLQSQDHSVSTPLYEAKLLILGEGEAGKTTLAKKLTNPDYKLDQEEKSTEGIQVVPYEFDHPDGQPCRINIWDFGGQEIYHATHQFFLSGRSVYALVVDARKENPNFYYWLKVIQLYGGDSPVIIIKNEKQDRPCSVNDRQLRSEFTNLEKSLETNLGTNRNLDGVKATIERYISDLPHVGDRIPNPWANVRAVLENLTHNYISIQEYRQICCRYSITDPAEQKSLSQFLHDLGIFLHFQKNLQLKKTIFLKPEWSTDAVYKVLDAKQVKEDCGRFCDQDIEKIWNDPQYNDMQGELLALMKAFEVCYGITGRAGHYIAPHLLEPNPPAYDIPWNSQDNLILTYRYTFKPKNIFSRLIVALHEYIEYQRMVWKHGVILTNGSARAEIIEDDRYHQADIRIRIFGTDKKQWLSVIGHHLDRINASFENLDCEILFPCNCSECKGSQTPYEFPYKDLCRSLSKRNYTLKCLRSFEEVSVQTLINDVTDPRAYHERAAANPESPNSSPFTNKVDITVKFPEQQYQESNSVTVGGDAKDAQIIAGKNNTAKQTTEINQLGQRDNVAGNKIEGDSINTQINNQQDLTQLGDTLTALLQDLSEEYNATTAKGQAKIQRDALKNIRQDPTLQQRLTNAFKAGSEEALEQMITHPLAKIIIKAIKGLIEG